MTIKRDTYLQQLIDAKQNGLIKVITGPRRCGKSFLLTTIFHEYLIDEGVGEDHIIEIALEDRINKEIRNFAIPIKCCTMCGHWLQTATHIISL